MTIKALLIDLDGTIISRGELIAGAKNALQYARDSGYKLRFLTNITGKLPEEIADELSDLGLEINSYEIQTAATACADYIRAKGKKVRCHFMIPSNVLSLFDGIEADQTNPDFVVVSDIGTAFTFETLNQAFLMLRKGASLIALQKNFFWYDTDGPKLDCGAFVVGLEAASGKTATVMGKPAEAFFLQSLAYLNCTAEEIIVIGDDIKTDIAGAKTIHARSVLVGTGKFEPGQLNATDNKPDFFLPSIAELPRLLNEIQTYEQ